MRRKPCPQSVEVNVDEYTGYKQLGNGTILANVKRVKRTGLGKVRKKFQLPITQNHFRFSKIVLLCFMQFILSMNKSIVVCKVVTIPSTNDLLLDSLTQLNEDDDGRLNGPYTVTPIFPEEEPNDKDKETNQDRLETGI